jgi:hypothetical protein
MKPHLSNNRKNKFALLFAPLLIILASCSYDKDALLPAPCNSGDAVSFATQVAPVIKSNCFSCHNNSFRLGNVSLDGYDNISRVASSGKLIKVISHEPGSPAMPQGAAKLDDCTISTIKKWVDNGNPQN